MDFECLKGLPDVVQVNILLSALETITVDVCRVKAIYLESRSESAKCFLEEHEQSASRIKDRILFLFNNQQNK